MKKILILTITFGLLRTCTYAQNTSLINSIIQNITSTNQDKTPAQQISNYQSYITKIQSNTQLDTKTKAAFVKFLTAKIDENKKQSNSTDSSNITVTQIPNVNMDTVRTTRLNRHNNERTANGLSSYSYNSQLEKSALNRATYLNGLGKSTHQRSSTDGYYNYNNIKNRFSNLGISFKDTEGTQFSESIGRGYYTCTSSDCTSTFIKSIKSSFDFFMSEKYKSSQPHYKGIIGKQFTQVGVSISINPISKKYFLVTHYSVDTNK